MKRFWIVAAMACGLASGQPTGNPPRNIDLTTAPLEAFLELAGAYQSRGDAEGLYRVVTEGIKRFPAEKRFYLTAGAHLGRAQRFDEAIRVLTGAAKRWPEDAKIRELLASAYFERGSAALNAGQDANAAADLERAAELAPGDLEAFMNLGRARHNLARYEEALSAFEHVIAAQPGFPLARFHRGMSHYSLGNFDAALADLEVQAQADPAYAPAYLVRGMAWLSKGDAGKAVVDLERAAGAMPENAAAQYALGRALLRLNRLPDAERHLRVAVRIDPEDPAPANTLVTVLARLGLAEEARALSRTAAELARRRRTAAPGEIRFERHGAVRQ